MKKFVSASMLLFFAFASYSAFSQTAPVDEPKEPVEFVIPDKDDTFFSVRDEARGASRARSSSRALSSFSYGDGVYVMSTSGSSSSQLSLSKTFEGESKKNEGSFEVDETVRNISLTLSGAVRTGEIKIKITMSNEDVIKEMSIDESADILFTQTIKIAEDVKKYYGKWSYTIESVKAEGNYKLMIHTR